MRGLALIVVVGVLGVLAVLAVAFVTMAELERKASQQRVNGMKAYLLAHSGVEDALARLEMSQDPAYGGENWDASIDGLLSSFEAMQEVYLPTGPGRAANILDCPVRHAMRPSFFASAGTPHTTRVDGKERGYSGKLSEDYAVKGNTWALKVADLNAAIFVNGGALDALDRDPDGPSAGASGAAAEVAPFIANGVADFRDASMEGPNGFLVRLLNNLDAILTEGASSNLGAKIVGARPPGGYGDLRELQPVLGARYEQVRPYLTVVAWVDPKVSRPQPPDSRPNRFLDIDEKHRVGANAPTVIAGVATSTGVTGAGTETSPWVQSIAAQNDLEGAVTYPVRWERNYLYAWRQIRLAPAAPEPRAPVNVNAAPKEVLAAVFLGLKGTYLEVWEDAAGYDAGFGWYSNPPGSPPQGTYSYPDPASEEAPWHRTRLDAGMGYGSLPVPILGTGGTWRSWYPGTGDPNATNALGDHAKPVVRCAPLGRLKETPPVSRAQATEIAGQVRARAALKPFRTWADFNDFIDRLPLWEDANADGILDGVPYNVAGSRGVYVRRQYLREDVNSDGIMNRETFTAASGDWATGIAWRDMVADPAGVPGLTFAQKDVIKAMANPNADLNDFNPDANLWKEVDKTDVVGIGKVLAGGSFVPDASAYVHTTELALGDSGGYRLESLGRVLGSGGRLLAQRQTEASVKLLEIFRDTTQADFMRGYNPGGATATDLFAGGWNGASPYPLAGGQALVSYPEPQTGSGGARSARAPYDGQIGLGLIGALPAPPSWVSADGTPDERLLGDLFDTLDATGLTPPDIRQADAWGPFQAALLGGRGAQLGSLFPDGAYGEKDTLLRFQKAWLWGYAKSWYLSCWVKPNWFPEAATRPHALIGDSYVGGSGPICCGYGIPWKMAPVDDLKVQPGGLYFVPARNNYWQKTPSGAYVHDASVTLGGAWPSRSLLFGTLHCACFSDSMNRQGVLTNEGSWSPALNPLPAGSRPVGRLQAHRWTHVAAQARDWGGGNSELRLTVGRVPCSSTGSMNGPSGAYMTFFGVLRLGEPSSLPALNYTPDATYADLKLGGRIEATRAQADALMGAWETWFKGPSGSAATGRYCKEAGACFVSSQLPGGLRPLRITWTEIPANLWFDPDRDGWMGDPGGRPANDQFGPGGAPGQNGKRDVRIDLEVWDDMGTSSTTDDVNLLGGGRRLSDPAGSNPIPKPTGQLYYKAVFVNEWDAMTRANFPLDVTPFLDDVTISYTLPGGAKILAWEERPG